MEEAFRCGDEDEFIEATSECDGDMVSSYVRVGLTDTYSPIWSKFGVGSPLSFSATRYVLIKQQILEDETL